MADARHGHVHDGQERRRHGEGPGGSRLDIIHELSVAGAGAEDGDRAGMGHGRRDRPQADPLAHLERPRHLGELRSELSPAVVRLGAGEHQHVPLGEPTMHQLELRPGELTGHAVHDAERRPSGAVVEDPVDVEGGDRAPLVREQARGECRAAPGIHPAIERRHDHRGCQWLGADQTEEGHRR
jgi:hypothetical protein